jgi:hypothetical protein
MLNFKDGIQFLGLLLILLTCVICLNYTCQKPKKEVITNTITKRDTVIKYVYGAGKAKRVINKIYRVSDTVTVSDTFIVFRDRNIDLEVNHINSDTPIVNYRIKQVTIKDSIFIKQPYKNTFGAGAVTSARSFTTVLTYSTKNCNFLGGYDVINKQPNFGVIINLSNIANR